MALPYHKVNVLTGFKAAAEMKDPKALAKVIKKAQRPLLVVGPKALSIKIGEKLFVEYLVEIAKAGNIPVCATAHTKGKLEELGLVPDSTYDIMEIINHLKDPEWKGVKGEGNHDLVLFGGFRTDLGNQGLSTLKHFAPHLRTMTLCRFYYPNATFSLPNIRKDEDWKALLEGLVEELKTS
ncbi:MAG: CO dehydrogenase/acetyl-CoA synthase complex subunit epsilon [Deltaproteobacteria bacterium]|nr:MAG: CO dehydrogenase/acetyl-CoA synthase complex subunit epsilon [Deltaproteobacteria bacterium]